MRRNEVPTPSQINDHFVFKTSPSPTELFLHLPTQLFEIGLSSGQSMRELNPIHLLDRKVCKTITLHRLYDHFYFYNSLSHLKKNVSKKKTKLYWVWDLNP